jgi:hypothetical protein
MSFNAALRRDLERVSISFECENVDLGASDLSALIDKPCKMRERMEPQPPMDAATSPVQAVAYARWPVSDSSPLPGVLMACICSARAGCTVISRGRKRGRCG